MHVDADRREIRGDSTALGPILAITPGIRTELKNAGRR